MAPPVRDGIRRKSLIDSRFAVELSAHSSCYPAVVSYMGNIETKGMVGKAAEGRSLLRAIMKLTTVFSEMAAVPHFWIRGSLGEYSLVTNSTRDMPATLIGLKGGVCKQSSIRDSPAHGLCL